MWDSDHDEQGFNIDKGFLTEIVVYAPEEGRKEESNEF